MDNSILETTFSRCQSNPNVYTKKLGDHIILLVLYVEDLILIVSDPTLLALIKFILRKEIGMILLGHFHNFIGIQVLQAKEEFHFPS
jgi:hypothetical protein